MIDQRDIPPERGRNVRERLGTATSTDEVQRHGGHQRFNKRRQRHTVHTDVAEHRARRTLGDLDEWLCAGE